MILSWNNNANKFIVDSHAHTLIELIASKFCLISELTYLLRCSQFIVYHLPACNDLTRDVNVQQIITMR